MLNFNIKYILVDFSLAQLNALKNTFQVPIFGCYFHFIKCITKKINSYLEVKNRRDNFGKPKSRNYFQTKI